MNFLKSFLYFILTISLFIACGASIQKQELVSNKDVRAYKYLAIGDSYTKGESVCDTCGFPQQLVKFLKTVKQQPVSLTQIAETGWTTTQLKNAILKKQPAKDFDFVTLLIGVNNQFQGKPFLLYENEFKELLNTAIEHAGDDASKVLVLSIPDYGFTPYGKHSGKMTEISEEIDAYNKFAETIAKSKDVAFLHITDITRDGLKNPELVAKDGLHPSKEAYKLFTERIITHLNKQ